MMHTWYHNGTDWIGTGIMVIAILALLATVSVLVLRQRSRRPGTDADALRILQTRLARGDIDDEEYRRIRTSLRSSNSR